MATDSPGVKIPKPEITQNQLLGPTENVRHDIESAVQIILTALQLDQEDPSIAETPRRVTDYLLEFRQPCDPIAILGEGFACDSKNMVMQQGIPFRMICEHHLLPALGRCSIAYIPQKKVVGLSKLPRLVDAIGTERPSLQELITERIAVTLHDHVDALGTMVVTEAEHTCMACRGVTAPGVNTIVSSVHGNFARVDAARVEFLMLTRSK